MRAKNLLITIASTIWSLIFSPSVLAFGGVSHCDDSEVVKTVEDLGIAMVAEQTSVFEDDVGFEVVRVKESLASGDDMRVCQAEVVSHLPGSASITSVARYSISKPDWSGDSYVELRGGFLKEVINYQVDKEMEDMQEEIRKEMEKMRNIMGDF